MWKARMRFPGLASSAGHLVSGGRRSSDSKLSVMSQRLHSDLPDLRKPGLGKCSQRDFEIAYGNIEECPLGPRLAAIHHNQTIKRMRRSAYSGSALRGLPVFLLLPRCA